MSNPTEIVIPEKIQIKTIRLLSGNITADPNVQINDIANYQLQYGASDELYFEQKLFRFIFSVKIHAIDKNGTQLSATAEYSIEFVFSIENLEDYTTTVAKEKQIVEFKEILPATLLSIVYSTARGLILARTEGTIMGGVILPVIDIIGFLKSIERGRKSKGVTAEIEH